LRGEEYTAPRGPIPGCVALTRLTTTLHRPSYISDAIGLALLAFVFVVQKLSVDAKRRSAG
jgi:hypothetical protein